MNMMRSISTLLAFVAFFGATRAEAIVIGGGKTGLFTLVSTQGARIQVANTGESELFLTCRVLDSNGMLLLESVAPLRAGQGTSFEYAPVTEMGSRLAARVELNVSADRGRPSFIPTLEVFDLRSGMTQVAIEFQPPDPAIGR